MKSNEELTLEEQVERIRNKRNRNTNKNKIQKILNTVFLILATIGLVCYFYNDNNRLLGLSIIGISLIVKIFEFIIRFIL